VAGTDGDGRASRATTRLCAADTIRTIITVQGGCGRHHLAMNARRAAAANASASTMAGPPY